MLAKLYAAKYRYLFGRLIGRYRDLLDAATNGEVICPEETGFGDPAIYLPGQLEKVQGVQFQTSQERELARVLGGPRIHAATQAFLLKDVILLDGALYKGRYKRGFFPVDHKPSPWRVGYRELEDAALTSSYAGTSYFGQWLTDDCTQYILASERGTPLCIPMRPSPDVGYYARCFGQDWTPTYHAAIERLVMFIDFSQNSLKCTRYRELRMRLRGKVQPKDPGGFVYIARGNTGARRIIENEASIVERLKREGFRVVEIFKDSTEEILSALLDAKVVVSVEGSHMNHATYTIADGASVIAMQPPDRFCNFHKDWTECLGMKYGFVVGDPSENGFTVSPEDLMKTIELAS